MRISVASSQWLVSARKWVNTANEHFPYWLVGTIAALAAITNLALPRTYWSLDSLDGSYQLLDYQAIQQHLVFGSQFIETWGPLGFIDNPQFYDRYLLSLSLLFQVVTTLALVVMVTRVMKQWMKAKFDLCIVLIVLLFAAGSSALASAGWRMLIIAVLLALDRYATTGQRVLISNFAWATVVGFLIGAASATEASYALLGFVIVIVLTAANLLAGRFRVALAAPAAAALTFVAIFLIFGGGPRGLLSWPHWELQNISGYSAAMGLASSSLGRVPFIFGVGCVCICVSMVAVSASRSFFLIWPGVILLAIGAQAWKEGFVRSDLVHVPFFFSASIWVLFVLALLMSSTVRKGVRAQMRSTRVRTGLDSNRLTS